jgi:hypothetical protein
LSPGIILDPKQRLRILSLGVPGKPGLTQGKRGSNRIPTRPRLREIQILPVSCGPGD